MKYMKISILLLALLVVGAGSAEAQECIAKAAAANVRAEGMTEQIGTITLRCRGARSGEALRFEAAPVDKLEIAVTLNADITNDREGDDNDMIGNVENVMTDGSDTMAGYSNGMVVLTARTLDVNQAVSKGNDLDEHFSSGAVSDDLQTVTWKVVDGEAADEDDTNHGLEDEIALFRIAPVDASTTTRDSKSFGFEMTIAGLRADASALGDGGEVTATVSVNGDEVGSYTAANVKNGLEVSVDDAEGKECEDSSATAKITLKEGYKKNAFMAKDQFTVTFRNIPEGVSVMVPAMTAKIDDENEGTDLQLVLEEGGPGDGVGDPDDDGMAMVELTASGMGAVMYKIGMTKAIEEDTDAGIEAVPAMTTASETLDAQEWVVLNVTFKWDGGTVSMNNDAMVYVSFHPTGGSDLPRFAGDSDADMPLNITDCVTNLTFPFVSSASGYDTGIVVSNTKDAAGTCTASYSGSDETMTSPMIEGNSHWIFLVSSHMEDYSGRLMVECDFGGIDGYAQINDAMNNTSGYLPRGNF